MPEYHLVGVRASFRPEQYEYNIRKWAVNIRRAAKQLYKPFLIEDFLTSRFRGEELVAIDRKSAIRPWTPIDAASSFQYSTRLKTIRLQSAHTSMIVLTSFEVPPCALHFCTRSRPAGKSHWPS